MADITMCPGTGCPLKTVCYRHTAQANEHRQSWADFTKHLVIIDGVPECPEFVFDTRKDDAN